MIEKAPPRSVLAGTNAEQILLHGLFRTYLYARLLDKEDRQAEDGYAVFTSNALQMLDIHISDDALKTPVLFTDRLSNRALAIHFIVRNTEKYIAINARFKMDPDVLAHSLIEEYVHAQQIIAGVDIESQRQQFTYSVRPYEVAAKQIASEVLGYDPSGFETVLIREEPVGQLYDRP